MNLYRVEYKTKELDTGSVYIAASNIEIAINEFIKLNVNESFIPTIKAVELLFDLIIADEA